MKKAQLYAIEDSTETGNFSGQVKDEQVLDDMDLSPPPARYSPTTTASDDESYALSPKAEGKLPRPNYADFNQMGKDMEHFQEHEAHDLLRTS